MTRNGKIARLPKMVQVQLNQRLDGNEPGKKLVVWLNSLPEVQAMLTAEFAGLPIREQNLSEWKKGGYCDWQQRQERREWAQQLQAEAGDLESFMPRETFDRHVSMVMAADLALAFREVKEHEQDAGKRVELLGQLAGKIAQLRREESNAVRVGVIRGRWERELAAAETAKRAYGTLMPEHALMVQRLYIDGFSQRNGQPLMAVGEFIDALAPQTFS